MREATPAELGRIHPAEYLAPGGRAGGRRRGHARPGYLGVAGLEPGGRLAAGACIEAVSIRYGGRRTGGHSAWFARPGTTRGPTGGWGFASTPTSPWPRQRPLPRFDVNRVLIADFDVHHGNGTQEIFYESARVGVSVDPSISVLSGHRSTRRDRHGRWTRIHENIPLPYGTSRTAYHAAFRDGLEKLADRVKPELVMISAGFDAHAEDPVGDLGLEIEDFEILTRELVSMSRGSRPGADFERARRRIQRADPGRIGRGPSRRTGRQTPSRASTDRRPGPTIDEFSS